MLYGRPLGGGGRKIAIFGVRYFLHGKIHGKILPSLFEIYNMHIIIFMSLRYVYQIVYEFNDGREVSKRL